VAIAISEAKEKGLKVPEKRKNNFQLIKFKKCY